MRWQKQQQVPRRRQAQTDTDDRSKNVLFRRNRTLTGSLSTSVNSANEMSGDLRSPRVHAHHLSAHRRRLSTVLTVVFVIIIFLTWLLYEFTASIRVTPTDSSAMIDEKRYVDIIDSYYGLHPIERLRILTNNDQLNDYVKRMAPEVASIRTGGSAGFATGQFDMTTRKPIAGWLIGNEQSYVDSGGVAFKINYFDPPAVKIVDQSGIPQTAGATVVSSRFLSFVGRSVAAAQTYGLTVEQAIIPEGTTRQVELKVTGRAYPAKLSLDRPVGEQVEDMQRAIAFLDGKKIVPKYIDVRVSGRAFYQ